jgi:ribosome-binding protein aMBF1 (putative translation factor)
MDENYCKLCGTTHNLKKIIRFSNKEITICSKCYDLISEKNLMDEKNRIKIPKRELTKRGL